MRGDKITTKLILENETDHAVCLEYQTMTEEEKMLSSYAEELKDIFCVGEEEMTKKNFIVSRLRRQLRKERKLNVRKYIYICTGCKRWRKNANYDRLFDLDH